MVEWEEMEKKWDKEDAKDEMRKGRRKKRPKGCVTVRL
jgi:hypothetical protein